MVFLYHMPKPSTSKARRIWAAADWSTHDKIKGQILPRHMTDKGMTGNIQNRFNKINPRVGYDETSVLLDEMKAAEASADFWK